MSTEIKKEIQLEIAHVLFIDIVAYSKLSINEQRAAVGELTQIVRATEEFQNAEASERLIKIATGDGMALVFYTSPEAPVRCAVEISRVLQDDPRLRVRMGIHSGAVSGVVDVTGQANLTGAGLTLAHSVMGCCDGGHILLAKHIAEDLTEFEEWRPLLHDLGTCEVKHGVQVAVVNLWSDDVGNRQLPQKFEALRKQRARVRWVEVAAAVLLLAGIVAAFVLVSKRSARSTSIVPEESIAVLPFENASNEPNSEYLSEGISEALINSLSELQQLRVIARPTAFRYKPKDVDPRQVGRELGVAAVLTGKVRQVQDALNVQVDLVDAVTGAQIWGAAYDRKIADLLAVKQAIAQEVTAKLKLKLSSEEQRRLVKHDSTNAEAYQFYLRGRYFWNKRTSDGIKQAIEHFQQSIERDPNFALGYVGLADSYTGLTFYNFVAPHEAMPKAKESAIKALTLDDTLAEAHTTLAHILINYDWNWSAAEKEFKRSIELKPDYATAHQWYAIHYLTAMGRLEEAVQEMKKALELEPASLVMNTFMGATLYHAGRYDEAIDQCRRTTQMDPNFAVAHWHLGLAYEQKRLLGTATEEFKKAISLSGGSPLMKAALGRAYAESRKMHDANEMLNELNELAKRQYASAYEIATIYVVLGDNEQAFQSLEKAYAEHSFHLVNLNVSPQFQSS